MRYVEDHMVENDPADQVLIEVLDEPGAGNANHHYMISSPSGINSWEIKFQNGTVPENGVNGVTLESLLAIVADRLKGFQSSPFACRENAIALTHCQDALMWLQARTRARIKRGVEGTHQK